MTRCLALTALDHLARLVVRGSLLLSALLGLLPAAHSNGAPPLATPPIATATAPLHVSTTSEHPTMLLALSMEFPTTGVLYQSTKAGDAEGFDTSYDNHTRYIGYFDAQGCYAYRAPTAAQEPPPAGRTANDMKRFDRIGAASAQHTCSNSFSGNFLNWALSSSIDMLRVALSGGDRYIDTATLTTLQRAYLPPCMNGTFWQPYKVLDNTTVNGQPYRGAIPHALIQTANQGRLYFANASNRFFVGTQPIATTCSESVLGQSMRLAQTSGLSPEPFFLARVRVCEFKDGLLQEARHWNFCTQYPNGQYKPTGSIQKYSHQLRVAVFSYLDNFDINAYGGVLRAPMKYVGPRTFDTQGRDNTPAAGNPQREWDPDTGIYAPNPDSATTHPVSGVINFLNQFGRRGTASNYKQFDPVSELYYQGLRYLQGLPPSPQAILNAQQQTGGFPVYTTWDDPFGGSRTDQSNYACLKNNIALIGDIFSHDVGWRHLPAPSAANNIPDFKEALEIVRSFEEGRSRTYTDSAGNPQITRNPNPASTTFPTNAGLDPAIISRTNLMAYTYWARTQDIRGAGWTGPSAHQNASTSKRRPGLRVRTFIFDVNEMNASSDPQARKDNQFFLAAKYGGFETSPTALDAANYNPYGNPFYRVNGTPDNRVWQKPDTSDPATYFLQNDAQSVLEAFDTIFDRASIKARSLGSRGRSSDNLTATSSTHQYVSFFNTGDWSGDVQKQRLQSTTDHQLSGGATVWSAAAQLHSKPWASRKIFTGRGVQAGTAFVWDDISPSLRTQLAHVHPHLAADGYARQRLDFLRGSRSAEGSPFRVRQELLGDIAHSNTVYHGAPPQAYRDAGYAAFREQVASRPAAVYVGANDGMLHAFDDANGSELFAYIPSWLGPKLAALTDGGYATEHQSYVDGPITVKEAQVAFEGNASDWKTILVGSTGTGGAGVFALDVSQPQHFGAEHVLWEFTRADDTDLGQVLGTPQLLKFKTSGSTSPATYRWFAVFGSGINNYVPQTSGGPASTTGAPALFMLALDKPAGQAWQAGINYHKISFPPHPQLQASHATGLLNFSVLYGGAGEVTQLYAGDLHGNLWKLQWGDVPASEWSLARLSAFNRGTAAQPAPYPLYTARDAAGQPQPITAAPVLFAGPVVSSLETFYVAFGTGKYLEALDTHSTAAHSVYVVFDNGQTNQDAGTASFSGYRAAIAGRQRLAEATVDAQARTLRVPSFRWGRASSNSDTSVRSGWHLDLPGGGERVAFAMQALGTRHLAFNTLQPNLQDVALGVCSPINAQGRSYAVDIIQGQGQFSAAETDRLGPALYFTQEPLTTLSPTDSTGRRIRTITRMEPNTSTSAGLQVQIPQVIGRLSWREVHNYQDLRAAP